MFFFRWKTDDEIENCDEKKKELNYDAKEVDELEYYVWDWIDKKPLRHKDIKSNPKMRIYILPRQAGKVFKPRKKNFKFPSQI